MALIERTGERDRASATQAVAGEIDAVGVVEEAIEDGVGIGRIADDIVPAFHRKLACHKGGAAAIALFEDFKQVLPGFGGEGLKAEIVEDEKIGAAEERRMRGWRPSPRAGVRSSKSFGTR